MSRLFILRLRNGPLRHSIASGYVYETTRSFVFGGAATLILIAKAARGAVSYRVNHLEALVRDYKYCLARNRYYQYKDFLRVPVRGQGRGITTMIAKDDGFSVKSNVKVGFAKTKHIAELIEVVGVACEWSCNAKDPLWSV